MATQLIECDMDRRRITVTSGERKDEWRLDRIRRASAAYGRTWSVVFHDALEAIALVKMPPAEAQVLALALSRLHPKEWTRVQQTEWAVELAMSRSAITKALAGLRDRGCLCRDGPRWRVSLWLAWQGTAGAYQKERRGRSGEIAWARAWHVEAARQPEPVDPDAPFSDRSGIPW